jgi:hypothetical protein
MAKSFKGNERRKREKVKGGVRECNCRTIMNTNDWFKGHKT